MDILVNAGCKLGENPLWDERKSCLYWTDIDGGTLHCYRENQHNVIYRGDKVGGFTLQEDGSLLLFRVSDIARLEPGGEAETLLTVQEGGMERFNDVIATPGGDVFAGTVGSSETSGGVYRIFRNGVVEQLWDGSHVANGMGFSPDLKYFYWTDSAARHIYRFYYDETTHKLSGRELICDVHDTEGFPDGLAVAADGSFFSARYGGGILVHHAGNGRVLERLELNAENVTSAAFGGVGLKKLYVTSAAGGGTEAGAVFEHNAGVAGRPEFRSQVLVKG